MQVVRSERSALRTLCQAVGVEVRSREVLRNFRIRELRYQYRVRRVAHVHHVDVVHGLRLRDHAVLYEAESLALVRDHAEVSSLQRQSRVRPCSGEPAREGRHEPELSESLRSCEVGDIEHIQSVPAVAEVGLVAEHERRPVHPAFVHEVRIMRSRVIDLASRHSVDVLVRCPPAADLFDVLRIRDVHDPVDHALVLIGLGREMHVVAAVVHEAVDAHRIRDSAVPVSEELRILRILFEVVYHDALQALHLCAVADQHSRAASRRQSEYQLVVGDLQLRDGSRWILLDAERPPLFDEHRISRIRDIAYHDAHALRTCRERSSVEKVSAGLRAVKSHLEHAGLAVKIAVAEHFEVLYVTVVAFAFRIKIFSFAHFDSPCWKEPCRLSVRLSFMRTVCLSVPGSPGWKKLICSSACGACPRALLCNTRLRASPRRSGL